MIVLGDEVELPEEYTIYQICKKMKWDYHTYKNQPDPFIKQILIFMVAEDIANKINSEKNK